MENNNQNFKYIKNFKSFDTGYGRTSDSRTPKTFKIGDIVEVYEIAKKHAGKSGTIVTPTDLHKADSSEMVKIKFEDGKSDYLHIDDIFRKESIEKKRIK